LVRDCASAAWRAASSAWRAASASRFFSSSALITGAGAATTFLLDRLGNLDRLLDLHERALLADLDLDRAGLARRIGALDLGGLLARERDLLGLGLLAVHLLQVVAQARLVLLGDGIVPGLLVHARRPGAAR
jgi:hypothetical protein